MTEPRPDATTSVFADAGERLRALSRVKILVWLVGVIAALAIAWTLRETRSVTMPLAFAFFIAIAVLPVSAAVRARMPRRLRWLGPAAGMAVILVVLGIFLAGLWAAAEQISERLPGYADEVGEWWGAAQGGAAPSGAGEQDRAEAGQSSARPDAGAAPDGRSAEQAEGGLAGAVQSLPGPFGLGDVLDRVASYADAILSSAASVAAGIVLIFFFTLLMLLEAPRWGEKLETLGRDRDDARWARSVTAIAQRFRWYLLMRTILGAITGTLYGLWTWAFGLEFALVWGLLGFLLNYVPTLGSLVAGTLPVLFAFFTQDIGTALVIAGGLLVIEQIMGNFVDPRLQGRQLSLSPLVVLFSLLVWGWVWGIPGALLAVPLTVLITIVFAHVSGLRKIALILSEETDMGGLDERTKPY